MITQILSIEIEKALTKLYSAKEQSIQFQKTRKDFEGDITLVVFPLLRASKKGQLYVNTAATLAHHHDQEGRPNKFKYGKMVLRNGWYVWRIKYPDPGLKARFKWHATALLLTTVRVSNVITSSQKKEAFSESIGRIFGWFSLLFNKPKPSSE